MLRPASQRVQSALRGLGIEAEVGELPRSTRTAREAAEAVGVTVGEIPKASARPAGASAGSSGMAEKSSSIRSSLRVAISSPLRVWKRACSFGFR